MINSATGENEVWVCGSSSSLRVGTCLVERYVLDSRFVKFVEISIWKINEGTFDDCVGEFGLQFDRHFEHERNRSDFDNPKRIHRPYRSSLSLWRNVAEVFSCALFSQLWWIMKCSCIFARLRLTQLDPAVSDSQLIKWPVLASWSKCTSVRISDRRSTGRRASSGQRRRSFLLSSLKASLSFQGTASQETAGHSPSQKRTLVSWKTQTEKWCFRF